jgi:hypothetical protein
LAKIDLLKGKKAQVISFQSSTELSLLQRQSPVLLSNIELQNDLLGQNNLLLQNPHPFPLPFLQGLSSSCKLYVDPADSIHDCDMFIPSKGNSFRKTRKAQPKLFKLERWLAWG